MTQPPDEVPPDAQPRDGQAAGEPPPDEPHAAEPPAEAGALAVDAPATEAPPERPNPIISASDAAPAPGSGWVSPATPAAAPTSGWALPEAPMPAPGRDGFVIAGVGARIVAYLIDAILVGLVPTILTLLVLDLGGLMAEAVDAARRGAAAPTTTTLPVTLELALVTLVGVGIHFIYFVGFWTSGGRATPGMRGLRMQVVEAVSGRRLAIGPAVKRWIPLGSLLGLLSVVEPLQTIAGPLSLLLLVVVFVTVAADLRHQGLHDRWAGSLVIRSASSGNGAVAVGCLVIVVAVVALTIIAALAFFSAVLPFIDFDAPGGGIPV